MFYQVAPQPLITVSREHFIGEAIELCGGENIYAAVPGLTAVVSIESVVAAAPDASVANDYTRGPGSPVSGAFTSCRWAFTTRTRQGSAPGRW